jgi:hypothetical protein
MSRYDALRKKIDKMKKGVKGNIAPYIAFLNATTDGYKVSIGFWDGKENSGDKMPKPVEYCSKDFEKVETFLVDYLTEHKPLEGFKIFAWEEHIYD